MLRLPNTGLSLTLAAACSLAPAVGSALRADAPVPAAEKANDPSPPEGFQSLRPEQGSGEVLVGVFKGAGSAKEVLARSLDALAGYFDGRPRVLAGLGDRDDQEVQAVIEATRKGKSFRGLVIVHVGPREAVVGIAYDRAGRFAESGAALGELLSRNLPRAEGVKVKWQRVELADGSGTIKVPEGWQLNPVNAMVSGWGPQGSVDLGIWVTLNTPQTAAQLAQFGIPPGPVVEYGDPSAALEVMSRVYIESLGGRLNKLRVIDRAPTPGFPGKSAWFHVEAEVAKDGKTEKYQTVALVSLTLLADGRVLYYSSSMTGTAKTFARNLPVLLEIWNSWKVSDAVFQKRLQAALESMKATYRIIQDVYEARQRVMVRACDDWSELIRGTRIVRDDRFGTLAEVPAYELEKAVREFNRREGYERWKIIPLKDLNNP
jgi:hypothetical protein